MIDRPDPGALLAAMAATLRSQVVPALDGSAQHSARVVANLCEMLGREAVAEGPEATVAALGDLLGVDGTLEELVAALDGRLRDGDEEFDRAAHEVLLADATRRLAIARPSYLVDP